MNGEFDKEKQVLRAPGLLKTKAATGDKGTVLLLHNGGGDCPRRTLPRQSLLPGEKVFFILVIIILHFEGSLPL